jgi:rhodanese-related sulfurtransferase
VNRILCLCVLLIAFLFAGCGGASGESPAEYVTITAEEAKQMMDDGEAFILLDVRTAEEFAEGHISGAILIPDTEITERAPDELPDQDARILVYCRSGRRSALASGELARLGYTQVYDFGGIIDWPYETVSE